MKLVNKSKLMQAALVVAGTLALGAGLPAMAQNYPAPPPSFSPAQLNDLVSRIALYPDPLLAQVFAAASFPDQIPDAARFADQYRGITGEQLADTIAQANLQFDPAVQSLIPFPDVLDMMARDMNWTSALGNAVLADRAQVMDAVQQMRRQSEQYGYLRSNQQIQVTDNGGAVDIEPTDPSLIYVPVYDPYVVYAPPRPGFYVGAAIGFGPCYSIGAFGAWGWGGGFNWYNHAVVVNHVAWGRTWYNRDAYVHNYRAWDGGRGFVGGGNQYRGYQAAPAQQNRGWDRNQATRGYQAAPVQQNRGWERNDAGRGYQGAPVQQNRSYERNDSGRGYQAAPVQQYRSYERNDAVRSYQAPMQQNRSYQAAPVQQNRGSEQRSFASPAPSFRSQPSSMGQARSFSGGRGSEGGHAERNFGGRR